MFSFQTKQSVNRKHSHGSKALPPGVVKYLCQGAVCDDPSPNPFFPADDHLGALSHGPRPRWSKLAGTRGCVFGGAFHNSTAKLATR